MREITEHQLDSHSYTGVSVWADDSTKTVGNAPALYRVDFNERVEIAFMTQPPNSIEGGNGLTNEVLLCIVLDRLRGFQTGPGVCRENAIAITDIESALLRLQARARRANAERAAAAEGS
jgi:hypothetical protein